MKVLDHGYVELVEFWGSDRRIIESARMSTDGGFRGWGVCRFCGVERNEKTKKDWCNAVPRLHEFNQGDERLLSYLYRNKHQTPFEMAGITFEIKAPIFVFRQWHRHRTQSYNEMSARYTPIPDEHYLPEVDRLLADGGANKQASGVKPLSEADAKEFRQGLQAAYEAQESLYRKAISTGVPKELARLAMPVARYSRMRASANLRNWLAFLVLRMDSHAQWEIKQYADAVGALLNGCFPRTWELFVGDRDES